MSVAVTLTISDGFIVGVDSAVTVSFGLGKTNIYEDAEKIFQLGEKRIGIATVGLAGIGARSIGSFVREFESVNPNGAMDEGRTLGEVTESLRAFFHQAYATVIIPAMEALLNTTFDQIPINDRPTLGLLIGGYSGGAFLPEVWEIRLPEHNIPNSAQLLRAQGIFGLSWHATNRPIHRYINGVDPVLRLELEAELLRCWGGH